MVQILLATYNGEKYISKQINSILNQTFKDWNLLIRDDGSTDNTLEIIQSFISKYPNKISLLEDGQKNLGAKKNFMKLLENSTGDYIFFCDQDDIWFENKIEKTLEVAMEIDPNIPFLIHTNAMLMDEEDRVFSESFWNYSKINSKAIKINELIIQNNVTGCTMCVNKALKEIGISYDNKVLMHDWWLALVASIYGKVVIINEPTMYYRQHSQNEVGAKSYNNVAYKISKLLNFKDIKKSILGTIYQAESLLEHTKKLQDNNNNNNNNNVKVLKKYIQLKNANKIKKINILIKNKFYKFGFARNVYLFFVI